MKFNVDEYCIRGMNRQDFGPIARNLPTRVSARDAVHGAELAEHNAVFPQGQFVAEHLPTASVAGVHFTLRLKFEDFHIDDSWDVLTDLRHV